MHARSIWSKSTVLLVSTRPVSSARCVLFTRGAAAAALTLDLDDVLGDKKQEPKRRPRERKVPRLPRRKSPLQQVCQNLQTLVQLWCT